jgi:hypothetical protein
MRNFLTDAGAASDDAVAIMMAFARPSAQEPRNYRSCRSY